MRTEEIIRRVGVAADRAIRGGSEQSRTERGCVVRIRALLVLFEIRHAITVRIASGALGAGGAEVLEFPGIRQSIHIVVVSHSVLAVHGEHDILR